MAASGLDAILDMNTVAKYTESLAARFAEQGLGAAAEPGPTTAETDEPTLTPSSRARLRDDLAALAPLFLLWHLPRDDQGRLALGERVLLARYESATPLGAGRHPWLVAALPARRHDPQVPTLRLMPLIAANHTLRWDEARWLWDARETETCPAERRWGFPLTHGWRPTPVDDATAGQPDGAVFLLADPTDPGEVGQVERCLALQDAGELVEALALYDIELAPAVGRLVRG